MVHAMSDSMLLTQGHDNLPKPHDHESGGQSLADSEEIASLNTAGQCSLPTAQTTGLSRVMTWSEMAVQTDMTGYDIEEHKSRTPPKSSQRSSQDNTGTDSVDGARVLVERMPSVISGTPPRTNGTPPKGPPVVKLDTKFSSNSSSTVTLTNETIKNKPEGRRKKLRRKKYGSSPSRSPRRPSPGKSPVRFPSNTMSQDSMTTTGAIKPLALRAVKETRAQSTSSNEGAKSLCFAY